MLPVAFGVVILVSLLIHTVPGDPVDHILGDFASFEDKQSLREQLGLNDAASVRAFRYLGNVLKGDLGESLVFGRPVSEMIYERAAATVELALLSLIVAIMLGLGLGFLAALFHNRLLDHLGMGISLLGVAIPNFWLGPMLIILFSIKLNLLPVSERAGFSSYILPAITIGTALAAILSRMTRNSVLENLGEGYVEALKAKGMPTRIILFKHVLRNASLPLVTIIGLQFGVLLTGSVVTERVFDWPGLGTLILEALGNRDYPLVQGCVLVFSFTYLLVNLSTDVIYRLIDARVQMR